MTRYDMEILTASAPNIICHRDHLNESWLLHESMLQVTIETCWTLCQGKVQGASQNQYADTCFYSQLIRNQEIHPLRLNCWLLIGIPIDEI